MIPRRVGDPNRQWGRKARVGSSLIASVVADDKAGSKVRGPLHGLMLAFPPLQTHGSLIPNPLVFALPGFYRKDSFCLRLTFIIFLRDHVIFFVFHF